MSKEIIQSVARQQVNAVRPFMSMMMLSPDDQATYLRALLNGLDDVLHDVVEQKHDRSDRGRFRDGNARDRHIDNEDDDRNRKPHRARA
jgi:hypothetical protein